MTYYGFYAMQTQGLSHRGEGVAPIEVPSLTSSLHSPEACMVYSPLYVLAR